MPSTKLTPEQGKAAVDALLATFPDEHREVLQRLRATILKALPQATERISYGLPTIVIDGRGLIAYSSWKAHCALYLMSSGAPDALREDLVKYDLSGSTLRFSPGKPLPATLVRKIVKYRLQEALSSKRNGKSLGRQSR